MERDEQEKHEALLLEMQVELERIEKHRIITLALEKERHRLEAIAAEKERIRLAAIAAEEERIRILAE